MIIVYILIHGILNCIKKYKIRYENEKICSVDTPIRVKLGNWQLIIVFWWPMNSDVEALYKAIGQEVTAVLLNFYLEGAIWAKI